MLIRSLLSVIALGATTLPATADAEDAPAVQATSPASAPPSAAPPSGITLPAGKGSVAVNIEINMSAEAAATPLSIAPDVAFGATDDLTLALIHSTFGQTGFRAKAGGGLCLSGTDNKCVAIYDNVGAEGWYNLIRGAFAAAAVVGFHATSLDAGFYEAKLGAKLKYTSGAFAVIAQPSIGIALTKRTENDMALHKDSLWFPVQVTYRAARPVTVGVGTGIKGPVQGFADGWQVPLGVSCQYALDSKLGLGASWTFGALVGGATNPPEPAPGVKGVDPRGVQIWGNYSW